MRRGTSYFLLAAVLAIFAIFLLWPIFQVLRVAFVGVPAEAQPQSFTLGYFKAIFLETVASVGLPG